MKVLSSEIPDVLIIEPEIFGDDRGFFFESFNQRRWKAATGFQPCFVQDNHSRSVEGVLRGLHYQIKQAQAKLIRCIVGEVFDVAVDLRQGSPTYSKWVGEYLSAENKRQMWVPEGFAHGFLALTEKVELLYKATDYYAPEFERVIRWDDPDIGIEWPLTGDPILAPKDESGLWLKDAEVY